MPFGTKDVFLEESENEEFFEFLEERNRLVEEFNKLNKEITRRYVPDNVTRKDKYAYDHYATKVRSLQQRMLDYENKTLKFLLNPKLGVTFRQNSSENDRDFILSHAINVVTTLRSEIISSRNILITNYESLIQEAESARNFKFAKRSYWAAIIGLFFAMAGLIVSISN